MTAFFQLIRWPNLLILALTQTIVWFCIIHPITESQVIFLDLPHFLLLMASTVCIAAAGYIINDYFDVKIDLINKPEKVIIERKIKRKTAILLHWFLNIAGIGLAAYLCFQLKNFYPIILQILTTVLLWFYSTHFKRQYIVGNVIVGILTALTIITLIIYEPSLMQLATTKFSISLKQDATPNPFWVAIVYSWFAFMLTWIREIVKDMEDFRGDFADGCDTMPIRLGLVTSSRVAVTLGLLALIPLLVAGYHLLFSVKFTFGVYVLSLLALPLSGLLYFIPKYNTPEHYKRMSLGLKVIMVLGILALVVYYF